MIMSFLLLNISTNVLKTLNPRDRVEYRDMRQTRHSFSTYHLSREKNPLQIAKVMGHRNVEMVIKVDSKYIENAVDLDD